VVAALSTRPVANLLSSQQRMNTSFDPLRLVNSYGAFGSITRVRHELLIEGTDDPDPGPESTWKAYGCKAKPGDPKRRPPQVAPYHLRLDWLLWFAAMSPQLRDGWLEALVLRLLEGDRATLRLLRTNPFPDAPPRAIRITRHRYRFTTRAERKATGDWWVTTPVGTYLPPVALASGRPSTSVGSPSRRAGRGA
jgi:hypothetical protein